MADHTSRIAEIRDILRAGVRAVTIDGVSVQYDFEALRVELRQLMAEDDTNAGRRPVRGTIYLGGF